MKLSSLFLSAGLLVLATPVAAQEMDMPGISMPMPAKPAPKKRLVIKKVAPKKAPATKASKPSPSYQMVSAHRAIEAAPDEQPTMPQTPMPMSMPMGHDGPTMAPGSMPEMKFDGAHMVMTGALGTYPMERQSSGTAWQPDASSHQGLMKMSGDWTLMAHGVLNLVADTQSGRRGDDKVFLSGMLMGMARRPVGIGTLQFKAMLSPDPLMGPSGYPLLLASGETANGTDRLIDRQHPHDFFMELSASVSQQIAPRSSVFVYAGLPGEPAFGPPAFMHREAILDSPEAPISHHWLDSTHISFGVVTAGLVLGSVKVEASRFNGREPDQHRWNIETGPLGSTSVRLSWNPARALSLQGSWGHFTDPEHLELGVDQTRWSASLLYADDIAPGWKLAGTFACGRQSVAGHDDDAFAAEASLKHGGWTVFGRGELTDNRELSANPSSSSYRVGKVSLGAVRDFRLADHLSIGAGGLFAVNFVAGALAPFYGGENPTGAMGFLRLKLN